MRRAKDRAIVSAGNAARDQQFERRSFTTKKRHKTTSPIISSMAAMRTHTAGTR